MERFVRAVEDALNQCNWYAALSLSLMLPDVCARLETPDQGTARRYARWWAQYVEQKYTDQVHAPGAGPGQVFLSGRDAYALRCAFLHEGSDDTSGQSARQALERFHFVIPRDGRFSHCNIIDDALVLELDAFCRDICEGVRAWLTTAGSAAPVQERLGNLLTIRQLDARHPDGWHILKQ